MTIALPNSLIKAAILFILFSLILVLSRPVFAQNATSTGVTRPTTAVPPRIDTRNVNIQGKIDNMKDKMASREAALKLKLQAFRDQKKASAAARISDNLNRINAKDTAQMTKYLDKMSQVLTKLENRVNSHSPDIKDADKARQAIANARAAIASASSAVNAQAQVDYTIQVGSEKTVKTDAKGARDKLHNDLKTVRGLVIAAKQSVANAIRVAKSGMVEIPGRKEGTTSGAQ